MCVYMSLEGDGQKDVLQTRDRFIQPVGDRPQT